MERSYDLFDMMDKKKDIGLDEEKKNSLFNIVDNLNTVPDSRYPVCMEGSPLDNLQKKFSEEYDRAYGDDKSSGMMSDRKANFINENVNNVQDYLGSTVDLNDAKQVNARFGLGERDEFNIADNLNNVENSRYPVCVKDSPLDQVQNKLMRDFKEKHPECSRKEANEFVNKNIDQLQRYLGDVDMNNSKQIEERMNGQRLDNEIGGRNEVEMIRSEMHMKLDKENLTGALKEQGHKAIDKMDDNRILDAGRKLKDGRSDNVLLHEVYGKEKADGLIRQSSRSIADLRNTVSKEVQEQSAQEVFGGLADRNNSIDEKVQLAYRQKERDDQGGLFPFFDSKELVR